MNAAAKLALLHLDYTNVTQTSQEDESFQLDCSIQFNLILRFHSTPTTQHQWKSVIIMQLTNVEINIQSI